MTLRQLVKSVGSNSSCNDELGKLEVIEPTNFCNYSLLRYFNSDLFQNDISEILTMIERNDYKINDYFLFIVKKDDCLPKLKASPLVG